MPDYMVIQGMPGEVSRVPLLAGYDWIEPGDVFSVGLEVYYVLALELSWRTRIRRGIQAARREFFSR